MREGFAEKVEVFPWFAKAQPWADIGPRFER